MSDVVVSVEGLWKEYRLGSISHKTLRKDIQSWFARIRGSEDPNTMVHPGAAARATREGRFWALQDVSFSVQRGEVLGVIGRNGAGKSTVLKIMSRVTGPTKGVIRLRGRMASLLEVGTGFHPELTGTENVYLNGAILGMTRADVRRRLDEIVAFAEIEQFIDTPVKRYSSGMYVRLAFAVAAHLEPDILVVDEVLAVGDLAFQQKCLGKMGAVASEGRTILFVSHNMAAVQKLCTRAVVLDDGRLAFSGDVTQAIGAYQVSSRATSAGSTLAERRDRKAAGPFQISSVEFIDGRSNNPVESLHTGQNVQIRIGYQSKVPGVLPGVGFSIAFSNSGGALLFACRSEAVGATYDLSAGTGWVTCRIARFPVSGGRYYFNLLAFSRGTLLDRIDEAGYIDVVTDDYYHTGKIPAPEHQSVLIDFAFQPNQELGQA